MSSTGGRVLRATAVVGGSRLAMSSLGFLKHILGAFYFGTSGAMDAYLVALVLPDVTMALARTGIFNIIPLFAAERARSQREAWAAAGKMLTYWLVLLIAVVAAAVALTPHLVVAVAPGFAGTQRALTAHLTRILFLMALGVGAARVLATMLYAEKRFLGASASEVVFQSASIVYLIAFHRWGIWALAWGMVFGGFAQLLVVGISLLGHRHRIHPSFDLRSRVVRRMVRLTVPMYIGTSGAKLNGIVRRVFASMLPAGAVSALQYAYMLIEAPVSIGASSLAGAFFPFLSEQFAENDGDRGRNGLSRALVGVAVVFMPLSVGTLILAAPIVRLLFERGSFDARSSALAASALRCYAPAILAMALNRLLTMSFHARQDTATPTKVGLARMGLNAGLCAALIPGLGLQGIALATTVSEVFKLVVLLVLVERWFPGGEVRRAVGSLVRLVPAVAAMALAVYPAAGHVLPRAAGGGPVALAAALGLLVLLGCASYAVALRIFCHRELSFHLGYVRRGLAHAGARLGWSAFGKAS